MRVVCFSLKKTRQNDAWHSALWRTIATSSDGSFFKKKLHFQSMLAWMMIYACMNDCRAQFSDVTEMLGDHYPLEWAVWGSGTSFFDFNEDGLDDLTFGSSNNGVFVYMNTGDGFEQIYPFGYIPGILMQTTWIDLENDGDNDFFVARLTDTPMLFLNDGNFQFTDISATLPCPAEHPNSTCASWGDYDNDSYPDVYISNYHPVMDTITSWLFHNNGDGTFEEIAGELNIDNGVHQAFQCIWMDYDLDVDLDLLIVNDKDDGCKLYENDGFGNFTDRANETGFNINGDLMGLAASDYDHDGDFDFFITNNEGNRFMQNDGGTFHNAASEYGLDIVCTSWACLFIDNDNSSWEDVYVLSNGTCNGDINYYHENMQGENFNELNDMFSTSELPGYSASKGDYNNDGLYDIMMNNGYLNVDMQLWKNSSSNGNYIKLNLNGVVSNRHGIGSNIQCYSGGYRTMKAATSGDNFMSQDSQNIIFGIGSSDIIDSLVVQWPSGWKDIYYNLGVNAEYMLTEGETIQTLESMQTMNVCEGTSALLQATSGESYLWNNGAESQTLVVEEPGVYSVDVITPFGISHHEAFVVSHLENPTFSANMIHPTCHNTADGAIYIETSDSLFASFAWHDELDVLSREQLSSGTYDLHVTWSNSCESHYEFNIESPSPIGCTYDVDTLCHGTQASVDLNTFGGTGVLQTDWFGADIFSLSAGNYPIRITDENGCFVDTSLVIHEFPEHGFMFNYTTPCYGEITEITYAVMDYSGSYECNFVTAPNEEFTAGHHMVIITDDSPCASSVEFEIVSHPPIEFQFSYTQACFGEPTSIEFVASGGASENYEFDFFGKNPLFMLAGEHQVQITDDFNCSNIVEFNIEENSEIIIDTEIELPSDFESGEIEAEVSGGTPPYSIIWNETTEAESLVVTEAGVYTCHVEDATGCIQTSSFDIINLHIDLFQTTSNVYPNPVVDLLTIELLTPSYFHLYDAVGKWICSSASAYKMHQLDVAFLSEGIYFIEVNGVFYKIVKG